MPTGSRALAGGDDRDVHPRVDTLGKDHTIPIIRLGPDMPSPQTLVKSPARVGFENADAHAPNPAFQQARHHALHQAAAYLLPLKLRQHTEQDDLPSAA